MSSTRTEVFRFHPQRGWSVAPFPALDSPRTLVLVFCDPAFETDSTAIAQLMALYPTSVFLGCSSVAQVSGATLSDHELVVSVTRFEKSGLRYASAKMADNRDSFSCAQSVAQELNAPDLKAVFVLADGVHVNGSALVAGLNSVLPKDVAVSGGFAADDFLFSRTLVLHEGQLESHRVSAVGFYGENLEVRVGSKGGWDIFGVERRVTKSEGNVLFALDGKPALTLYKSYLGDLASELPTVAYCFPLCVRSGAQGDEGVLRTVVSTNERDQSMTFAGDVPQGSFAQVLKGSAERLIDGAMICAQKAAPERPIVPALSIAVSCMGRRKVLLHRTEEELEAITDELPQGTPQIGFYSYGEISTVSPGRSAFHNESIALMTMYET